MIGYPQSLHYCCTPGVSDAAAVFATCAVEALHEFVVEMPPSSRVIMLQHWPSSSVSQLVIASCAVNEWVGNMVVGASEVHQRFLSGSVFDRVHFLLAPRYELVSVEGYSAKGISSTVWKLAAVLLNSRFRYLPQVQVYQSTSKSKHPAVVVVIAWRLGHFLISLDFEGLPMVRPDSSQWVTASRKSGRTGSPDSITTIKYI